MAAMLLEPGCRRLRGQYLARIHRSTCLDGGAERRNVLLLRENQSCLGPVRPQQEGIREARGCHGFTAVFDDPNLVSCAGLAPVLELAERAGLQPLVPEHVHLGKPGGVNAHLKIPALVAGMVAGADSIDDMALLHTAQ